MKHRMFMTETASALPTRENGRHRPQNGNHPGTEPSWRPRARNRKAGKTPTAEQTVLALAIRESNRPGQIVGFVADGPFRGKVVLIPASDSVGLLAGQFAFVDLADPANRGVEPSRGTAICGVSFFTKRSWGSDLDSAKAAFLAARREAQVQVRRSL